MNLLESEALVVRTVDYGEADVVATLVTERAGKLSAIVRGARRGSRRLGGALEPVHTIAVRLEDKGTELTTLKEAQIVVLRPRLVGDLEALDAAGVALRWARHLFPPRTVEPDGWRVLVSLLDALETTAGQGGTRRALARAGLAMLSAVGYALELERCVVCGRACPDARSACIDPARGGIVCRSCGGAARVLAAGTRAAARKLAGDAAVSDADAAAVLGLVDLAMAAHTGFER